MLTYEELTKSDAIRTYIIRADESLTTFRIYGTQFCPCDACCTDRRLYFRDVGL